MICFTFDYETRAFTGSRRLGVGDIDPRSPDTLLVPGNATLIPPPRCGANLWPFWRNGQWEVFELVTVPDPPVFDNYYANL